MKIYLAAAFQRQEEMRGIRDILESWGHRVTSHWIDRDQGSVSGVSAVNLVDDFTAARAYANEDIDDIVRADTVISFTDGAALPARGGRHVEFGIAFALAKRMILVGPREHIFHTMRYMGVYPDWETLAKEMGTWCVDRGAC